MNTTEMLARLGITALSQMQTDAGQAIREEKNVVLLAPTGTGKTLAFLLPLLEMLHEESQEVEMLVISPTRELALQTGNVIKAMKSPLQAVCCYGGRAAMEEHRTLKSVRPQVVIATPGRMNDHLGKGNISTEHIRILVIDEFDKCLELGFLEEMEQLVDQLPALQKRILVSATDLEDVPDFAFKGATPTYLNYLPGAEGTVPPSIEHYAVYSPEKDKLVPLSQLLSKLEGKSTVVFVNYREAVERVGQFLKEEGFYCELFHGGMEQERREAALGKFRNGSSNVLVSTDLSARGLDIPQLENVVHYHLPQNYEAYLHRSGRTGRWESEGRSFVIINPAETLPDYPGIEFTEFTLQPPFPKPQPPEWVTLYIGKGKKDKLNKVDVVGFLCKKGGLRAKDIGIIELRDHYIYVAISRKQCRALLKQIAGEKIKGTKTKVELKK